MGRKFYVISQYVSCSVVGLRPRARVAADPIGMRLTCLERQGFLIILGSFLVVPYAVEQLGMYIISFDGWGGADGYLMQTILSGLGLL